MYLIITKVIYYYCFFKKKYQAVCMPYTLPYFKLINIAIAVLFKHFIVITQTAVKFFL